jgi:septum formation protein
MLILASQSPRRRELLLAAGFEFVVHEANVDETPRQGETADVYAERLARAKAAAVAVAHPAATVIGADTVVVIDDEILGKPVDGADARRMLRQLSGREHTVLTAVAVICAGATHRPVHSVIERTSVWMEVLDVAAIDRYIATGEPLDKAGAYAIQGYASRFIPRISGSYSNVVGLPIAAVVGLLQRCGGPYSHL